MKVINVEQGSEDWLKARVGVPTASCFDRIITPTGLESSQAEAYQNKLVAELIVGKPMEEYEGSQWMERGNELEEDAAKFYEVQNDVNLVKVGFVTNDEGTYGASPDRLIGDDGLLEIKCPAPHTHIKYMLDGKVDNKYYPQLQGQLLVTGREWVKIISYHPELRPVIITVKRNNEYLDKMSDMLDKFCIGLKQKYDKLKNDEIPKDKKV